LIKIEEQLRGIIELLGDIRDSIIAIEGMLEKRSLERRPLNDEDWMNTREAASYLKISRPAIYYYIRVNRLRYQRIEGGHFRFKREWIDELFEDSTEEGNSDFQ